MKLLATFTVFAASLPNLAYATAQIPDQIIVDGKLHDLFTQPLTRYLVESGKQSKLNPYLTDTCSASWRGFAAEWRVRAERLELMKVLANPCDREPKQVPLLELFPKQASPIVAIWFSGKLVVPLGEQLQDVHLGYDSKYERYLILYVKRGVIVRRQESTERPK